MKQNGYGLNLDFITMLYPSCGSSSRRSELMYNISVCLIMLLDILIPKYQLSHSNANCHEVTPLMKLLIVSVS